MGIFGKKRIKEFDAVKLFVAEITTLVGRHWTRVVSGMENVELAFEQPVSICDDNESSWEFGIALLVSGMWDLPNVVPREQADRIFKLILVFFCREDDVGEHVIDLIDTYLRSMNLAMERNLPPICGVGTALYARMTNRDSDDLSPDIVITMAVKIAETLDTLIGSWWKGLAQEFKIVP
jgi:hypothetical protein